MGINGGRARRGIEEEGYTRFNITLPPSIVERLEKYQKEEDERSRSWAVSKAVTSWLEGKGY